MMLYFSVYFQVRKNIIFLLFLVGFVVYCQSLAAQNNDKQVITILQQPVVGQTLTYEVIRGKIDSRNPITEKIRTSTTSTFSVIAAKGELFECHWLTGHTTMIGIDEKLLNEETQKTVNIQKGLAIKFLVDKQGVFQEMTNYEEAKKFIGDLLGTMNEYATNKLNAEDLDKLKNGMAMTYSTPELLMNTYCPELSSLFGYVGQSLHPDSVYVSTEYVPNPFSGKNFEAELTTQIDTIYENKVCFSANQYIAQDQIEKILQETFEEFAKNANKPFKKEEVPQLKMQSHSEMIFNQKKKIMQKCVISKDVETQGIKQQQILEVILKE